MLTGRKKLLYERAEAERESCRMWLLPSSSATANRAL